MENTNNLRKRRAVSPVIATVILVAVAITVSVAVAYWMGGIAGQYTQFEKVEMQTAIVTFDSDGNWVIEVKLKNSGSKASTLTNVFVNDVEVIGGLDTTDPLNPVLISGYGQTAPTAAVDTITTSLTIATPFSIKSGDTNIVTIWVGADYGTLSSGTTVNIKIHSAGGMDYIKLVQLI